ncbi:uncharacterized protein LOC9650335 [Selaginella moellendorffii]|uniref:uncharacterized protein LOC9650335 n=1 Tax=Selaginella moellendorffii TaxID=88036 RepID=UPI000D1D085C|nr:uncharacterized protein LOC9650335 [Selaginella moellendorffii]|eukprot:XP_002968544.2 uncharacterized protein LOC9650335 [Selaginella moellendorffii]
MASATSIGARSVCWSSEELLAGRSSWSLGSTSRVSFLSRNPPKAMALNLKKKNAKFFLQIRAVSSTPTIADDTPSSPTSTSESALILIRHGESLWNQKNLFTGCVDVPLSREGVEEAIEAGKRISNLPVDVIFTSALIRAQMTAMLAMTQHRMKKVPVILHNESSRANSWSTVFSSKTKNETIPVFTAWELNERMYGELQGLNKKETAEKYGVQKVQEWRRSYDVPPPNGESLAMCAERAVDYFCREIEPQLSSGKNVLIAAHGNSLRSIIMYLDSLTPQEVIELELSTGVPMLYVFKDGKFLRRGSPISPDSTGPYAFTPDLALYRERLDKMLEQETKTMEEIAESEN